MNIYSKKITLLMIALSLLNGGVSYYLTKSTLLFSQVMILTYIAQFALVFALGKVKK